MDVDFTFRKPIDVSVILSTLLDAGMRSSTEGREVAYLVDEDGMFEWRTAAEYQLNEVMRELGDPRWNDRVVGMTLFFAEAETGGDFLFHPGRESMSCVVGINPKLFQGSSRFCDIGWYLANLVPLLEPLGLSEIEARDSP
ncbi:hypothetical protein [Streptomyces bobili]|uniref:hypothetical protein n=1 Tax=Streptomyces bobili TaxID=67280 RepID=UPI00117BF97A|nr:hypothetical protein [Streptomyces bobili]